MSCLAEKDERCQRRPAACLQYSQRWISGKKAKYIVLYLKILFSLSSKVKKYVLGGWEEELVRHLTWSCFHSRRCHVILYFVLHHKRLPGPTERCSGKPDVMSSFTSSCIIKQKMRRDKLLNRLWFHYSNMYAHINCIHFLYEILRKQIPSTFFTSYWIIFSSHKKKEKEKEK